MQYITIRFYAELNDRLPPASRGKDIRHPSTDTERAGDILAMYGVPLDEVDCILRNGISVGPDERIVPGDRLSFYPVFESFDIRELSKIRPVPLRNPRFVLDVHLGKLASFMRMCGFDTYYRPDVSDPFLIDLSLAENRALLSKDRRLLEDPRLQRAYRVLSDNPKEQLSEVLRRFDLASAMKPFSRCIKCNTELERIDKEIIRTRLQPKVEKYYDEFFTCRTCGRVYWKGSHYGKMREFIDNIKEHQSLKNQDTRYKNQEGEER